MKKLVLGSVVAAALVFTGCGSSNDDDTTAVVADTTAPVITNEAAYTINEGGTVALTATDTNAVTYTETSAMFTISGATLTPEFATGTNSVEITATDSKGNHSAKTISVTVTPTTTGGGVVGDVINLGTNGEWLKTQAVDIEDDANTTNVDESVAARVDYATATAACTAQGTGWMLPTKEDIAALATNNVLNAAVTDATGTIELNTDVFPAGVTVIWTEGMSTGFFTGGTGTGNPEAPSSDFGTAYHTCVKK